ncbi:uncharacterized protein [Chironomus tepperi]|uniref:uncharacterized protein n=1 Tax=Chironomus tepperi TaxID=113505 RepID=UPI00391FA618
MTGRSPLKFRSPLTCRSPLTANAIRNCNEQFWCKTHSNNEVLMENSSLTMRTSCASGCSQTWKPFDSINAILTDGVRVGSFSPSISSFIGRALVNGELQIGRIQLSHPTGLYYTLDGSVRFANSSIEYLENSNFIWRNSSHGALVRNAVTVTASKNLPFYIGRIGINGFSYIGTVVRVLGLMYYGDENGVERTTDCYEVLTCGGGVDGVDKNLGNIVDNAEEMTLMLNFESTTSSLLETTEPVPQSIDNLPISMPQSTAVLTDHPDTATNSYETNFPAESSNFIENSSQIPLIVNETSIGYTTGYSYVPPSLSFPLSTATEHPQHNFNTTELSSSQTTSTVIEYSSIEAVTASNFNDTSNNPQNTSTPSSSTSSSHSTHPTHVSIPSTSAVPISIHSWTQVPPISFNGFLSSAAMAQMSSTEKVSTTITAEDNNEVDDAEQIVTQQLTGGGGDGEGLSGNGDENSVPNVGGDENLIQNTENSGQIVIENEGGIEDLGVGLNQSQSTATEAAHSHNNPHTIDITAFTHSTQYPDDHSSQVSSTQSVIESIMSMTTTEAPSTTLTPENVNLSSYEFVSTGMSSVGDESTTSGDEMTISGEVTTIFGDVDESTASNTSTTSSLVYLVSTDGSQTSTDGVQSSEGSSNGTSMGNRDVPSQTEHFNPQITEKSTTTPKYTTTSVILTNHVDGFTSDFTTTSSESTTEASKPNNEFQHSIVSEAMSQAMQTTLSSTASTYPPRSTTASTNTPRSTTSRTTRTRYTRKSTTKRTSTVGGQPNENNSKPSWLFTTNSITTEPSGSVTDGQSTTESTGIDVSTEKAEQMFECVPHWKTLPPNSSFLYDGIEITSQNTNFISYIAKININDSHILGKVNLKPQNIQTFSFYNNNSNQVSTTDKITYLSKAQLQNYSWQASSSGIAVKNAISISQAGNWPYYIGRLNSNGLILIGKVLPSIGLVHADKYGNEMITTAYEVLTCVTVIDEVI